MAQICAGILFVAPNGKALFLKRGPGGDYPGYWCFPGGHAEGDETLEQTAKREVIEEIGFLPEGTRLPWTRTISGGVVGVQSAPTALPAALADADKLPKAQVDYSPGKGKDRCRNCKNFLGSTCRVVEGKIDPDYWCTKFQQNHLGVIDDDQDDRVDFTTYLQRVPDTFEPTLNGEHTGFAWAPLQEPPEPLHPGCRVALQRFNMDETAVARAIAEGALTSPQKFENMWLFALRITGTGTSYRKKLDEYVYRRPENYLTSEFLARCNGLPVVMMHPDGLTLNSKEFGERVIGAITLPYIAGDEVWGIARIYDEKAARMMENEQLSTSPAVIWRDPSVNSRVELENGSKLLIEGKPSLLDHLAICEFGVWDKGGEPSGVAADSNGDVNMTDAEKKAAEEQRKAEIQAAVEAAIRVRADDSGTKLDKLLAGIDSINSRMDAFEEREKVADKARKDAQEKDEAEKKAAADKARKDADEKDEAEKKAAADKARKDADEKAEKEKAEKEKAEKERADAEAAKGSGDLTKRIAALESALPKALSDADYTALADAQAEADRVFSVHGGSAPRPLSGESVIAYQRRCATKLKEHSKTWKDIGLEAVADSAFGPVYNQIRADAYEAGIHPTNVPENTLREIVTVDNTGRRVTSFAGRPSAWMQGFSGNRRRLIGIRQQQGL